MRRRRRQRRGERLARFCDSRDHKRRRKMAKAQTSETAATASAALGCVRRACQTNERACNFRSRQGEYTQARARALASDMFANTPPPSSPSYTKSGGSNPVRVQSRSLAAPTERPRSLSDGARVGKRTCGSVGGVGDSRAPALIHTAARANPTNKSRDVSQHVGGAHLAATCVSPSPAPAVVTSTPTQKRQAREHAGAASVCACARCKKKFGAEIGFTESWDRRHFDAYDEWGKSERAKQVSECGGDGGGGGGGGGEWTTASSDGATAGTQSKAKADGRRPPPPRFAARAHGVCAADANHERAVAMSNRRHQSS